MCLFSFIYTGGNFHGKFLLVWCNKDAHVQLFFFCNSIAMTVPFTLGLVLLCMVSQMNALQSILTFFSSFSFKKYVNFLLLEKTLFMNYKEISSAILLIQLMFGPFNWALSCSFRLHTSKYCDNDLSMSHFSAPSSP